MNIDRDTCANWLQQSETDFHHCGECDALHLDAVRDTPGVVDCRLFVEPWGLLLTCELELRPTALLPISADLGRLNMDYPTLKLFTDVLDDAMPQLVASATVLTSGGLHQPQFDAFVDQALRAIAQLAEECLQLDYLLTDQPISPERGAPRQLH